MELGKLEVKARQFEVRPMWIRRRVRGVPTVASSESVHTAQGGSKKQRALSKWNEPNLLCDCLQRWYSSMSKPLVRKMHLGDRSHAAALNPRG